MAEFQIIERVGISQKNYSDAIKNAIKAIDEKRNIHFFKVIEQRGKVDNEKNIEFQVILKIGIL